jgi:hypothetical protein
MSITLDLLLAAAEAVVKEGLDVAEERAHPCDVNNDEVKAQLMPLPLQALFHAVRGAKAAIPAHAPAVSQHVTAGVLAVLRRHGVQEIEGEMSWLRDDIQTAIEKGLAPTTVATTRDRRTLLDTFGYKFEPYRDREQTAWRWTCPSRGSWATHHWGPEPKKLLTESDAVNSAWDDAQLQGKVNPAKEQGALITPDVDGSPCGQCGAEGTHACTASAPDTHHAQSKVCDHDYHIGVSVEPGGTFVQVWDGTTCMYKQFHEMPNYTLQQFANAQQRKRDFGAYVKQCAADDKIPLTFGEYMSLEEVSPVVQRGPVIDLHSVSLKAIREAYIAAFGPIDPNLTSNDIDWEVIEIIKNAAINGANATSTTTGTVDLTASGLTQLWKQAQEIATSTMPAPFQFARLLLAQPIAGQMPPTSDKRVDEASPIDAHDAGLEEAAKFLDNEADHMERDWREIIKRNPHIPGSSYYSIPRTYAATIRALKHGSRK